MPEHNAAQSLEDPAVDHLRQPRTLLSEVETVREPARHPAADHPQALRAVPISA
ncbi:hypothetical protein HZZ00_23515 [Streptomyces sp. NEAU-sy36]|uniref:hypothetical protein n=1 Tax=unclassified Streptomyces TaxID=2593676 RepID=UPI0015D58D9B|nr:MULTISPECIES: hypothetical protein [unclassified Streptomyces]QLJ03661.1 hypothetical protein HZZ00_23515 [Streptomyces sp. NEAU-sy36]